MNDKKRRRNEKEIPSLFRLHPSSPHFSFYPRRPTHPSIISFMTRLWRPPPTCMDSCNVGAKKPSALGAELGRRRRRRQTRMEPFPSSSPPAPAERERWEKVGPLKSLPCLAVPCRLSSPVCRLPSAVSRC